MEMESFKQKADKEYENLLNAFSKELQRLRNSQNTEKDKKVGNCILASLSIFRFVRKCGWRKLLLESLCYFSNSKYKVISQC